MQGFITLIQTVYDALLHRLSRPDDNKFYILLDKLGVKNEYTITAGRVEASVQLAYLEKPKRIVFVDGGDWALGLYTMKSDGTGAKVTVFMRNLRHQSPHLYFDYKQNNSILRSDFSARINASQLIIYESFISNRFSLYAPPGYGVDSLVIGAPDVLNDIDLHHMGADIEILGDQLYYVFPKAINLSESLELLIENSRLLAEALNDNLSRYVDSRAEHGSAQISNTGKRLINR